jgi:hypothetical protein
MRTPRSFAGHTNSMSRTGMLFATDTDENLGRSLPRSHAALGSTSAASAPRRASRAAAALTSWSCHSRS